jgi:hypothetical protein
MVSRGPTHNPITEEAVIAWDTDTMFVRCGDPDVMLKIINK